MTRHTILVYVGEDLLGDGILKLPFVHALRHQFPHSHITWFAGQGRSMYATHLRPLIVNHIDVVEDSLRITQQKTLREFFSDKRFDLIIDTQRDVGITWRLKRILHTQFISRTWHGAFTTPRHHRPRQKGGHLSEQLTSLLPTPTSTPFTVTIPSLYYQKWVSYFKPEHLYIGLAPGAGNTKKCWPLTSFIELAHSYRATSATPVFILGPQEKEWQPSLQKHVPDALFPLQDQPEALTSPLYTTGLGHYLKASVANDAGVGHLLGLSPTHLISLFGPTGSQKLHPYTPRLTIIRAQDFGGNAMSQIPVGAVKKALDQIILLS